MKRENLITCLTMLICCCASFLNAKAQNNPVPERMQYWGQRDSAKLESAEKIIAMADGRLLVAGTWQDSAWIREVSHCGAQIWDKKFRKGTATELSSILELPNGNLAAIGSCKQCAIGDSTVKAYVVLLDATGTIIRDTTLGGLNLGAKGYDIAHMVNGNLAVTGYVTASYLFQPRNILLAIFDPSLHLQHYAPINKMAFDFGTRIIATQNAGLAIVGYSYDGTYIQHATIAACNAVGDTLWVKRDTASYSEYLAVDQLQSGELVVGGRVKMDTALDYQAYMAIVNANTGQISPSHRYGLGGDDEVRDIHALPSGYLACGTYGLPSATGYGARDWFFRLDTAFAMMDQSFHDGFLAQFGARSLVPLSPNGDDWAAVSRWNSFYVQDAIFIQHHRLGKEFSFSKIPQDFQLYPRDSNNVGHVEIIGEDASPGMQFDSVRVEVSRNDTLISVVSQPLNYGVGSAPFAFSFQPIAMLANYRYQVLAVQGNNVFPEAEACDVVAGDAFIVTGQSNAVAELRYDPNSSIPNAYGEHPNEFVRNFGLKYANDSIYIWHKEMGDDNLMHDHRSGQWGLVLGDQIADQYGVPVAILNGGIGGIPIDSMMPNTPNNSFGKFLTRTINAGLKDHFRALLYFQGESDAGPAFSYHVSVEKAKFAQLKAAYDTTYVGREMNYLFQIRPGGYWLGADLRSCLQIAEAQRQIGDDYADFDVMSSNGMNHDSSHYYYDNGYERAGEDMFRLVARDLYGGSVTANMTAPNYASIYYSNAAHTEITIQLREPLDQYTWHPGWENDFYFEPNKDSLVMSGAVQGSRLVLTLSAAPDTGVVTGLSFASHPGGSSCALKNQNGIGMLSFYNAQVDAYVGAAPDLSMDLEVFPNPTFEKSWIAGHVDCMEKLFFKLYDLHGNLIWVDEDQDCSPSMMKQLPLPYADGLYLLHVTTVSGAAKSFRIVKM